MAYKVTEFALSYRHVREKLERNELRNVLRQDNRKPSLLQEPYQNENGILRGEKEKEGKRFGLKKKYTKLIKVQSKTIISFCF